MISEKKRALFNRSEKKAEIQLSEHFDCKKLLRFSLPTIIMMIFTSIYCIVDGFFVSNFAGKTPFAAVNFIMPLLIILGSFGFLFGTGGSALIAKTMGEGNTQKANELFSLIIYTAFSAGVIIMIPSLIFLRDIAYAMGAEGEMLKSCVIYGRIILSVLPFAILQVLFQCLTVTAEKPKLGLYVTVVSGAANIVLDAVFVGIFGMGLVGAASATAVSQFLGGAVPLFYFGRKNSSQFRMIRPNFDWSALIKTASNGSSEFLNQVSASIVGMLFNIQLMKYAGESGVAAYGVLMYVSMIFQAIFIGYTLGCAPVVSYHYGAWNNSELRNLRKKSLLIISVFAVLMFCAGQLLAVPFSVLFVGYDPELTEMTSHAFSVFSFSFLPSGFVIFASSFFTALNDGLTSALISFLRTLVFQCSMVIILPILWDLDGIWISVAAAELMAAGISAILLAVNQKRYQY